MAIGIDSFAHIGCIEGTGKTIAVLPSGLNKIYPQFYKAQNAWQTSFNNPSSVLHTITTLMNMSRIEQMGNYKNSYYDLTPSVARIIETVDKERVEIAKQFFDNPMTVQEIMESLYNVKGKIYFGEMTFTTSSGKMIINPDEWDYKIGEFWDITKPQVDESLVDI